MELYIILLLALATRSLAAGSQWCLDSSCDNKQGKNLRDGILAGMKDAIEMAANAFDVLTNSGNDPKVLEMSQLILGTDNYEQSVTRAKGVFNNIGQLPTTPSKYKCNEQAWKDEGKRRDVAIYCNLARMKVDPTRQGWLIDTSMEDREIKPDVAAEYLAMYWPQPDPNADSLDKACTTGADYFDEEDFERNGGNQEEYFFDGPYPCCIDLATWWTDQCNGYGWPSITPRWIERAMDPTVVAKLDPGTPPVDALDTLGRSLLHELTHTILGGSSEDTDVEEIPDVDSCYDWECIVKLQNVNNADNLAWLGVVLHMWKLGYWVDKDGKPHKR